MRMPVGRVVLAAGLMGTIAGSAGAGSGGKGFPTNLALLDRLAAEAVSATLDSLAFQPGDTVTVMTEGGNEGDGFVAGAFARELARRGIAAHMTVEVTPPAPAPSRPATPVETPAEQEPEEVPILPGMPGDSLLVPSDSLSTLLSPDTTGVGAIPTGTPAGGSAPGP